MAVAIIDPRRTVVFRWLAAGDAGDLDAPMTSLTRTPSCTRRSFRIDQAVIPLTSSVPRRIVERMPLKPGDEAPDFKLLDQNGEPYCLSKSLKAWKVLIYFYPGGWTPGTFSWARRFVARGSERPRPSARRT